MSKFIKTIIQFIVILILSVYSFTNEIGMLSKIISLTAIIWWTIIVNIELQDIVALKYKLVYTKSGVYAKYLTSLWLFIPYWKSTHHVALPYDRQTAFNYKTDSLYDSEHSATLAVEAHKRRIIRNRKSYFNAPEKDKVKYL